MGMKLGLQCHLKACNFNVCHARCVHELNVGGV